MTDDIQIRIPTGPNHGEEILKVVTRLETKMDMLISPDGEHGKVPVLESKMASMEKKVWIFCGGITALGGALHFLIDALKVKHGG